MAGSQLVQMSSSQGVKRKNGRDEMTGREKKKQKMDVARTIPVQSGSVARGSGSGVVSGACIFCDLELYPYICARYAWATECY